MNPSEMETYKQLIAEQLGVVVCFLCGSRIRRGEAYCMVPADCTETDKMLAGQQYNGIEAHWKCLEAIP